MFLSYLDLVAPTCRHHNQWHPSDGSAPPHLHGIGHLLHAQRRCAGPGMLNFLKNHWWRSRGKNYDWLVVDRQISEKWIKMMEWKSVGMMNYSQHFPTEWKVIKKNPWFQSPIRWKSYWSIYGSLGSFHGFLGDSMESHHPTLGTLHPTLGPLGPLGGGHRLQNRREAHLKGKIWKPPTLGSWLMGLGCLGNYLIIIEKKKLTILNGIGKHPGIWVSKNHESQSFHWIGLRENLQETHGFLPSNWSGFPLKKIPSSNSMILVECSFF